MSTAMLLDHAMRRDSDKFLLTDDEARDADIPSEVQLVFCPIIADRTLRRWKKMTDIAIDALAPPETAGMNGEMSAGDGTSTRDSAPEIELPRLLYGALWLVSAGDGDTRHLSPLGWYALGIADAVIHDPGIPQRMLDLVKPPRYRESAEPRRAIERAIKLARDGWRVVYLLEGNTGLRAVEGATRCADFNVPCLVVPNASEPITDDAPQGLLLPRKALPVGRTERRSALIPFAVSLPPDGAVEIVSRQRPLDFSMVGVAG